MSSFAPVATRIAPCSTSVTPAAFSESGSGTDPEEGAALAIGHLNLLSVAFGVLFIGLGVDFGVHLCMSYQEQLGRGAMRVLLEEVVLHHPDRVEADLVGNARLLECVLDGASLGLGRERPRDRQLVEDSELHTP